MTCIPNAFYYNSAYRVYKDAKYGVSVTDLVLLVLQLLREDIQEVVDFIKPVEL